MRVGINYGEGKQITVLPYIPTRIVNLHLFLLYSYFESHPIKIIVSLIYTRRVVLKAKMVPGYML